MHLKAAILLVPLFLAGCGTTEKTVVVNPTAGNTTIVDPNGDTHVQKPNN